MKERETSPEQGRRREGLEPVALCATVPHPCSYLPDREAVTVFVDPARAPVASETNALYGRLSTLGFRRSGEHIYVPACRSCAACVPVRVPVREFHPNRSQRRTEARHRDLAVRARPPTFDAAHFELYRRYLKARHPGGGMDDPSPRGYMEFLTSAWARTTFYEFRRADDLLAVAVTDRLPDGLSAVYSFFAPEHTREGLGTFAILWQIREAARLGLRWCYLGYWIEASPKMRYKADFRPQEHLRDGRWQRFDRGPAPFKPPRTPAQ